jgi:metallo-beta-lactamase family protein
MSKKKKNKLKVSFIGNNSCDVTGSMILIELEDKNILLECGMVQSQNSILDYKTNASAFPFKPKNIDYVFINHTHTDHMGLSPKLVRDGFHGKIITTPMTARLMKPMLLDSSNIIRRDAVSISKKRGTEIEPFYNDDDVYNTLDMINTYEYNQVIQLDENISFKFLHNSHIIGAAQLELYIKDKSGYVSKILYTSDLGSFKTDNYYVDNTEKCVKANIVISESTYGSKEKDHKINRKKDLEKIKTVVNQVCVQDKGRILIPVFSLARCQQIFIIFIQQI